MEEIKKQLEKELKSEKSATSGTSRYISQLADELARTLINRLPSLPRRARKKPVVKKFKQIEHGIFLDTSAIIDGRIFDVLGIGLMTGEVVILQSILQELKHIADSQDMVRRQRGQQGLARLEALKKLRGNKVRVLSVEDEKQGKKPVEVDERLIQVTKMHKGRIVTCDYNLEKKASIEGVIAINMNAVAQVLKVAAVPGEALHITISHSGKEKGQGVGYLDDGTMLVVEHGEKSIGQSVDVVVTRVIQTASGRILFAKPI